MQVFLTLLCYWVKNHTALERQKEVTTQLGRIDLKSKLGFVTSVLFMTKSPGSIVSCFKETRMSKSQ